MKKIHEILIRFTKLLTFLSFFTLASCIVPMKVANVELADSPHPILSEIKDDSSHLYFVNSSYNGKYIPTSVRVGSNAHVEVPYKTYTKFIVNPGKHWVSIENIWGKSGHLCQNFEKNMNYFFSLEMVMGHKANESIQSALNNRKQTKQIYIEPIEAINTVTPQIESIFITTDNETLGQLKKNLEEKYKKEHKSNSDGLLVKLKMNEHGEGSQVGRYLAGSVDKFKAYKTIEAEFYLEGKKVDSLVLSKEVRAGLLGGDAERLTPFFADDIASYINCVYIEM